MSGRALEEIAYEFLAWFTEHAPDAFDEAVDAVDAVVVLGYHSLRPPRAPAALPKVKRPMETIRKP